MDWTTDQLGRLRLRGVHDSLVAGLSHRDRTFRIGLVSRENDGLRTELRLSGVRLMVIDRLWEETIVRDVFLWNAHDVPENLRFDPNAGWSHLLEGRGGSRDRIDRSIEGALSDLPSGFLFSLTGSYGGNISILCEEVQVSQEPGPTG